MTHQIGKCVEKISARLSPEDGAKFNAIMTFHGCNQREVVQLLLNRYGLDETPEEPMPTSPSPFDEIAKLIESRDRKILDEIRKIREAVAATQTSVDSQDSYLAIFAQLSSVITGIIVVYLYSGPMIKWIFGLVR
ncbi:hypothetical protein OYT1_ch1720 [Ferriphaselus amnicola]|uniref:Uncharacterized protein n=1 Tax=Ferriphaselus amnicola TaxID=1188319 RepID=A0A2Z6GCM0_9PROT|nr:hypothetical protein [Ferriphaselus amnicola]BBE51258.1 hypothetical protein OYT1_ch1720 [Ferriphaselus amnicola]